MQSLGEVTGLGSSGRWGISGSSEAGGLAREGALKRSLSGPCDRPFTRPLGRRLASWLAVWFGSPAAFFCEVPGAIPGPLRRAFRGSRCGSLRTALLAALAVAFCCAAPTFAQDADPLNTVHVKPPAPAAPDTTKPAEPPPVEGKAALNARRDERIRVNVNLVLIPLTVTDPLDRLVTGLEKENFFLFEKDRPQTIKTFSSEDAPVSIGIILDLSGSMTSKFTRARESVIEFMKTANPQDEFFIIGFNDRPEVIEDYTSSVEDVNARLAMVKPGKRTALLDAIYMGLNKIKAARYERRALLIVSDGGDNRSRYTESEVRAVVRESDVQIYAIGIFDPYAATTEERLGPLLLNDLCEDTGGRMFRVDDAGDMGDIAAKISAELRNEYVLGYRSDDDKHDGKWRKVKVKLAPPPGLPTLTVHARSGYYAPLD